MKRKTRVVSVIICISALILLIFDTKTPANGALSGIELCMKVLIPSLFPFFLTITYLNGLIVGRTVPGFRFLGRMLGIPSGGESILFLGFLGGYPVGAKLVYDQYRNKQITKRTAHILLGYCSNAGPAFIFAIAGLLFPNKWAPLILWITHILSAVITGYILPKPNNSKISTLKFEGTTLSGAMQSSMQTCVSICGWVITFKILLAYIEKWLTGIANPMPMYILQGILELSNGCIALQSLNNEPLRFILSSGFLAFGGVCILLQTTSVTKELGIGLYIPGKLIQTAISFLLSALLAAHQLPANTVLSIIIPSVISIYLTLVVIKKRCGNSQENHV